MTFGIEPFVRRLAVALWATVFCTLAQATPIPFKADQAEGPTADAWGGALLVSVLALVALLFLVRRWWPRGGGLKGRFPMNATPPVRVLGSTRLNAQVQLTVVEFEQKKLLLAVTASGATVLQQSDLAGTGPVGDVQ